MEKSIINGPETCEVYRFLRYNTEALYDPENDVVQEVPWNFSKFLIDGATGQVVSFNIPRISPLQMRPEIEAIIKKNTSGSKPFVPSEMDFGGKTLSQEEKDAKSACEKKAGPPAPKKNEIEIEEASPKNQIWKSSFLLFGQIW